MDADLPTRLLAITLLGAILFGMFVGYDAELLLEDPLADEDDLAADPEAIVGEQIELSGEVVATDPVEIEVEHDDGTLTITVENAPDAEPGQQLTLVGTVQDPTTIDANRDRSFTREPWERQYMYAISLVGAALVAIRIANEWRFDPRSLTVSPRDRTLLTNFRGGDR